MNHTTRWDPCISHYGDEVRSFLRQFLAERIPKALFFVGGAGFDSRSCTVATEIRSIGEIERAFLVREIRPNVRDDQLHMANNNEELFRTMVDEVRVEHIDIFGTDGAVVGGRNVIAKLRQQSLQGVTDIMVDVSALSVGISFPIIRYLLEFVKGHRRQINLHLFATHDPKLDYAIQAISSDGVNYVHGFKGGSTLSGMERPTKLWLPQLAKERRSTLVKIHDFVEPDETCPVLPFPSVDPHLGDSLVAEFLAELENTWSVDARSLVHADEGDPLDLYRTILRLNDLREPVFRGIGGSRLVLSPLGGKAMALGALLAAVELDLPVAYVEPIDFDVAEGVLSEAREQDLIHLWLEGDVYSGDRPALRTAGGASG